MSLLPKLSNNKPEDRNRVPVPPTASKHSTNFPKRQTTNKRNEDPATHQQQQQQQQQHYQQQKTDAKETAALRRNVESLTKVSRQDSKTISNLTKENKLLQNQLRVSKAETKVALSDLKKLSTLPKPETDTTATNQINKLKSRMRELQHELTLSQRNEQQAKDDLLQEKELQKNSIQVKQNNNNNTSSKGSPNKLRQQLQTVSAHAKSLLVKNQQLERDLSTLRNQANVSQLSNDQHTATLEELNKEKEKNINLEQNIVLLKEELVTIQGQLAISNQRRSQHALDLSHRTQELMRLKNETNMMQRRMSEATRASELLITRDNEIILLNQKLNELKNQLNDSNSLREDQRRWEEDRKALEEIANALTNSQRESDSLRRTNQGLAIGLNKYKNAVDELHPKVIQLKLVERDNERLINEIQRLTQLQSSDFLILTTEMERLRNRQAGNVENEEFAIQCRMELDDMLLRGAEVRNDRLRLLDDISGLKRVQSHLTSEMSIQDQVLRDAEVKATTMAKTLENVKNELSGALRLQNALEDECDDSKRNVKRLERDMIDVEKERDFLKERMLVVENRCTELLMLQKEHANVVIERDQLIIDFKKKTIEYDEMCEKNEVLKKTMSRVRKNSVTQTAKKAGEIGMRVKEALAKTERELRATVSKLVAAEEASETAFTCMTCLDIMKRPVTCIPCGHSFCEKCLNTNNSNIGKYGDAAPSTTNSTAANSCPECNSSSDGMKTEYYIENQLLENLCARYVFRKQAISSLKNMTKALSSQVGN